MSDSFRADLDRRRFMVLAVAFGVDLPLAARSTQSYGSATIHGAIEIEDSRWIEDLLRHLPP
jgi:hypothetical protein